MMICYGESRLHIHGGTLKASLRADFVIESYFVIERKSSPRQEGLIVFTHICFPEIYDYSSVDQKIVFKS